MRFALVPGGTFRMGAAAGREDEQPVHEVDIDAFEIAVYPVTNHDYAEFLRRTGSSPPPTWNEPAFADPDQPVVSVSWIDAAAYCAWLAAETGDQIRLPTEAEWERAARGGVDDQPLPWGGAIPAWVPNGGRGPLASPWPVTLGEPNGFGLYGITANVHEWCADWYARGYYGESPRRNPPGPAEGTRRASRGGAWRHSVTISRSSARSSLDPSFRYTDYGFRIVRVSS